MTDKKPMTVEEIVASVTFDMHLWDIAKERRELKEKILSFLAQESKPLVEALERAIEMYQFKGGHSSFCEDTLTNFKAKFPDRK